MFDADFITNKGGREANEDACDVAEANGSICWVVADGLGGHRGGHIAARETVKLILESFRRRPEITQEALRAHLDAAHHGILHLQKRDFSHAQMQSTVVVLVSDGARAIWAHAGDSRLYHIRGGIVVFETVDHNVTRRKVDAGLIHVDEARDDEDRNTLVQSIGKASNFDPTVLKAPITLCRGDVFLLCVDGFWSKVFEAEMEIDAAKSTTAIVWLKNMEARLRERIGPGADNYTACAVRAINPNLPAPLSNSVRVFPAPELAGVVIAVCLALFLAADFLPWHPGRTFLAKSREPAPMAVVRDSFRYPTKAVSDSAMKLEFGIFEVTQAQWEHFAKRNRSRFAGCPRCPIESITWWEALEFSNRASQEANLPECYELSKCTGELEGTFVCASVKPPDLKCRGYRLPTEAEWEHVARMGYVLSQLADMAWFADNSGERTHPVGEKKANRMGAYDMLGNVSEWVWDSWGDPAANARLNPSGSDRVRDRVYRGGNWAAQRSNSYPTWRGRLPPEEYSDRVGFRLVRGASGEEQQPSSPHLGDTYRH